MSYLYWLLTERNLRIMRALFLSVYTYVWTTFSQNLQLVRSRFAVCATGWFQLHTALCCYFSTFTANHALAKLCYASVTFFYSTIWHELCISSCRYRTYCMSHGWGARRLVKPCSVHLWTEPHLITKFTFISS